MISDDLRASALALGALLCREALWLDRECYWIGLEPSRRPPSPDTCCTTLGGDLYGGSAGIAYFLADLYEETRHEVFRATAIGALRYAQRMIQPMLRRTERGLYDGLMGVALATCEVGRICGRQQGDFVSTESLLTTALKGAESTKASDVISGKAGIIIALIYLHEKGVDFDCLRHATLLADTLLVRPPNSGARETEQIPPRRLLGFAHGDCGVAAALLELYATTKVEKYRLEAERLNTNLSSYFNSETRRVPDLRSGSRGHEPTGIGWCHGVPGLLLAYTRTLENCAVLDSEGVARLASEIVKEEVDKNSVDEATDATLCHGLLGAITSLNYYAEVVQDRSLKQFVQEAIGHMFRRYEAHGFWECAYSEIEETPQLMTGTAGIGHALLTLAECAVLPIPTAIFSRPARS